jgi:hypothetical protein
LEQYISSENRFKILMKANPDEAKRLLVQAQKEVLEKYAYYKRLASADAAGQGSVPTPAPANT